MTPLDVDDFGWLSEDVRELGRSPSPLDLAELDANEDELLLEREASSSPTPSCLLADVPSLLNETPPKRFMLRRQHSRGALVGIGSPKPNPFVASENDSPISVSPAAEPKEQCSMNTTHESHKPLQYHLVLPPQVIQTIASYLSIHKSRLACLLVSKTWSKAAAKAIYRCPSVKTAKQFHSLLQTLLSPGIHNYAAYVVDLDIPLSISDELLMGDLDVALQLCRNLRGIRLENALNASNVLIQSLSDNVRHLRRVYLRGCPITDVLVPGLTRSCPRLERVDFSYTQATVVILQNLIDGCERIQAIELEACGPSLGPVVVNPHKALRRPLRYLNLRNSAVEDHHVRYAAIHCPVLESVVLDGCTAVTDDAVVKLAQSCGSTLRRLDVSFVPSVTDVALHALARYAKVMEDLTLAGCDRITPEGVQVVAKSCDKLQTLALHGCAGILGSFVQQFAVTGTELECSLKSAGIKQLAEHKQQQDVLLTRDVGMRTDEAGATLSEGPLVEPLAKTTADTATAVVTVDQTTQTDVNRPELPIDSKAVLDAEKQLHDNIDSTSATEILLKFADAIASGKWVPPGGNTPSNGTDPASAGWPNPFPPGMPPFPYWGPWASQMQAPPQYHPAWGYPPPGWASPPLGSFPDPNRSTESPTPTPADWQLRRQSSTETINSELSTKRTSILSNESTVSGEGRTKVKPTILPVLREQEAGMPTPPDSPPSKGKERDKRQSTASTVSNVSSTGSTVSRLRPPSSLSRLPGPSSTSRLKIPSAVTRGVKAIPKPTPAPSAPTLMRSKTAGSLTPTTRPSVTRTSTGSTLSAGTTRTSAGSTLSAGTTPLRRKTSSVLSRSATTSKVSASISSPAPSTPPATTTYKPRQFRKFNSSPDEIPTLSSRTTTPKPSTPTRTPTRASTQSDRERTKTLLRTPAQTSRLRWSHHLQPSQDGEGWIAGGTVVEPSPENGEEKTETEKITKRASVGSGSSTPTKTAGMGTSGIRPPSGLRMPTPVKKPPLLKKKSFSMI
ncbi:uncharacterized protein SPPG_06024 [Spizellomyces punctatus DAOM BR117]|uniref:F-box/LRR-repeat protein 15-like leucin rich repeat domain-containing protein n=1 Tax=Spizellomyces punctatus (strain DAOM BR117) TaxID=645134 RepID=A0A0L0HD87_SPIPD|nr:uncharacterized protein SPPG_06024 [Spizellomyces punctatus DAOM BR117]KNC99077.1 hypothetical protein SPPG_06024 [Spizellomyces punctatus DAOM BR117]|eukprot:XP_016607117.1 hypothetical protein SPPG_06024 [Spizellomyces punctatus DAOM BR117]